MLHMNYHYEPEFVVKNYCENLNTVKRVCSYDGFDDLLTIYWIDDDKEI